MAQFVEALVKKIKFKKLLKMKDMPKAGLKVLSVSNLLLFFFFLSCVTNKVIKVDEFERYKLIKYKHKNGFSSSILIKSFYDRESSKKNIHNPLSYININNINIKEEEIINGNMKPYHISVDSEEKYNILIYGMGLQPLKIKYIYIEKGDSIVIKAYLKENKTTIN